jgi:YD repeat-containing protein
MYRTCLILLFAASLFNSANAQKKSDRETAGLLGAVKSVSSKQTSYSSVTAKEEGQTKQQDTVTYDKAGNEIERIVYDDYGFLIGKETRTFNAINNLLETILADPQGATMEKQVFSYTNNKLTQIVTSDDKGATTMRQVNTYDAKNQLTEETYYLTDKPFGKTTLKYDARGNLAEVFFNLADGTKTVAPVGPALGAHREVYTYNAKDQLTAIVSYLPDGKVQRDWKYVYNAKGSISEDLRTTPLSRKKLVYTYEYDTAGNWIKQTGILSDLSNTKSPDRKIIVTREITYY